LDRPYHLALLTEAHIRADDRRRAAAALREAIEQVEGSHSFFYEAELWRLQGHLHWIFASDRTGAYECFLRALDVARGQRAKSLELRAAVSMTRLLRKGRERDKGTDLLVSIYRSFKGQRETPDLHDARAELEAPEEFGYDAGKLVI